MKRENGTHLLYIDFRCMISIDEDLDVENPLILLILFFFLIYEFNHIIPS